MEDHATKIKKLVGVAYADLPRYHQEEINLDLFCNSLNHAYLQRPLLVIKAGSEYLQIKLGSTYGANVHQVDKDDTLDQEQADQANLQRWSCYCKPCDTGQQK